MLLPVVRPMESSREQIGLPFRPFLYTLDQIATLLAIDQRALEARHVHFEGRHPGARPPEKMVAKNINAPGDRPDWRVAERELLRYLRRRRFRVYERGWVRT